MNERGAERAIVLLLGLGLIVTATICTNGIDHFRLPKELAFRAEAIALFALGAFWLTSKQRTWKLELRREFVLAAAIVCWTLITVATSTNRPLSIDSLITVLAAFVIFIASCLAAQTAGFAALDVLMIGACVNAILVILQELKLWTPFNPAPEVNTHLGSVGLLGNPNDVGTFLAPAALAAIVMTVSAKGNRQRSYAAIAALLVAGVAASATRTAIGALVIGLTVFAVFHSRRVALVVAAIVISIVLVALSPATTLGRGARQLANAAATHDYESLFSERLLPFITAFEMTRDHPLTGVGPGCFKFHYMGYRVAMRGRYPADWTKGYPMNWGEVHNDHLQVAAESGVPGYLLYLAAIALCIFPLRRTTSQVVTSQKTTFARALRLPLAALVLTLSIGQFPLELAAPRLMLLTLGALCVTWDREGADA
jgi:O-antigen ligase